MRNRFSIEEANAALEVIRPLVAEIIELRLEILRRQPEVWPVVEKALGNGGSREAGQMAWKIRELEELIRQIHATGAMLKDIGAGLVDFPSRRDGRQVFLCWKYDEPEVLYWHDLNAGFAGRQPV